MTRSSGKSKWVVVGGAGFIGSNLCRYLIERGDRVVCIDNMLTGSVDNIEDMINAGDLVWINHCAGEKRDRQVNESVFGADGIFYLASIASPEKYLKYPLETIHANVNGLKDFLYVAHNIGKPLLYTSTSEVYGDPDRSVQREDYNGNVCTTGPRSVYDESKRLGETLCSLFVDRNWADARIVRIFNTYGPGMAADDGRVIPNFINQALDGGPLTVYGDGSQMRSFCYVDDMVEGLVKAMRYEGEFPRAMNLGNLHDHFSIMELAYKVRDAINCNLQILEQEKFMIGDPKMRRPDCGLARSVLDWGPTTDFDVGLDNTIRYFRGLRNVASDTQ